MAAFDHRQGNLLGHELSLWVVLYHHALGEKLKLSATEHKVLDLIMRAGELTPGDIASQTGLSHAAVTKTVTHLGQLGYVLRQQSSTDRRSFRISPTPQLRKVMIELYSALGHRVNPVVETFDQGEQATIARWLEAMIAALKEETLALQAQQ